MEINYGDIIKNSRIKLGLSQCDISEVLDFSDRQMSRVENNKSGLSLGRLEILSDELKYNFVKLNIQTVRFKTYFDYVAFCELDKALISLDPVKYKRF
ncbi:MAG: helix-turn-helix domain-containing protein [Bacilli bacterium]